ncbi:YoaK family protein [Bernardetia sp.]|uniref:YoaK family protein n=1 Tax=Bernardetia sp. TaxID=1937974 RepID=UPI0025BD09E6|nr:YoaK family protein [Bernardetia sp.]
MFRRQGKNRTFKDNLQIAILLSFVAGLVNITGFLAFQQLTTNVTGHFALFVAHLTFGDASVYLLYIFFFLVGSFCSSLAIEILKKSKKINVFAIPTLIESLILFALAIASNFLVLPKYTDLITCGLLFSMGFQNSFVTKISDAVVRTTHLTGLFTDLGIEISHLFFSEYKAERKKNIATIKLRFYIITFFLVGGLSGGYFFIYLKLELNTLILGGTLLLLSLFNDTLRYYLIKIRRRYFKKKQK